MADTRESGILSPRDEAAAEEFIASFGENSEPASLGRNVLIGLAIAKRQQIAKEINTPTAGKLKSQVQEV